MMAYFAGLDVSLGSTSVCIVDAAGCCVREWSVPTDGFELQLALKPYVGELQRIGLEAGPLSRHLYSALLEVGLPAICVENGHMAHSLRAQSRNKSDRNDARGIAQMMRVGLFKSVHVKSDESQRLSALLSSRKILKSKVLDIEAELRGVLRNFGLKLGNITPRTFDARVRELASFDPFIAIVVDLMLEARRAMREQYDRMHAMLIRVVSSDPVCRRLMTMPGVGPVVSLNYRVAIDMPGRFKTSRAVGAYIGLNPKRYQSGETDRWGRVSKAGDAALRKSLYEAAQVLLTRVAGTSSLRSWGMQLVKRRGRKKATVAVARKMAVILHRMWSDGRDFQWQSPLPDIAVDR